jgi:hypothetical protein
VVVAGGAYVDVGELWAALGGDDGAGVALLARLGVGPHVVHAGQIEELLRVVAVDVERDLLALLRDPLEVAEVTRERARG